MTKMTFPTTLVKLKGPVKTITPLSHSVSATGVDTEKGHFFGYLESSRVDRRSRYINGEKLLFTQDRMAEHFGMSVVGPTSMGRVTFPWCVHHWSSYKCITGPACM